MNNKCLSIFLLERLGLGPGAAGHRSKVTECRVGVTMLMEGSGLRGGCGHPGSSQPTCLHCISLQSGGPQFVYLSAASALQQRWTRVHFIYYVLLGHEGNSIQLRGLT